MSEPTWVDEQIILRAHDMSIATHGGLPGVRDHAAFEPALARARNKWSYGVDDIVALAAAYGFGLARNHAFADGNKRTAYIASRLFLERNGFILTATDADKIAAFLALAAGELDEDGLAAWLRERAKPA